MQLVPNFACKGLQVQSINALLSFLNVKFKNLTACHLFYNCANAVDMIF